MYERDVWQLDIGGADAVDPRVVLIVAGAVDRKFQRSCRVGRDRMRIGRRCKAGQHPVDLLIISAERHGQVRQLLAEQIRVHFGRFRLQRRCFGAHGDVVSHRADLHRHVDARHRVDVDRDLRLLERSEPLLRGLQAVGAGGQVDQVEVPDAVGHRLAFESGVVVGDEHRGAGHSGA